MRNLVAVMMLVLGAVSTSLASVGPGTPEIDATTGLAAVTLVGSAILIIRSRRK